MHLPDPVICCAQDPVRFIAFALRISSHTSSEEVFSPVTEWESPGHGLPRYWRSDIRARHCGGTGPLLCCCASSASMAAASCTTTTGSSRIVPNGSILAGKFKCIQSRLLQVLPLLLAPLPPGRAGCSFTTAGKAQPCHFTPAHTNTYLAKTAPKFSRRAASAASPQQSAAVRALSRRCGRDEWQPPAAAAARA